MLPRFARLSNRGIVNQAIRVAPVAVASFKPVPTFHLSPSIRFFSTEATEHLTEVLEAQIREEEENSAEFDSIDETSAPDGWSMKHEPGTSLISFNKDFGVEVATITANAYELESDEAAMEDDIEEPETEGLDNVEGEEGGNYGVHVDITLQKKGGPSLKCQAVAWSKSGFQLTAIITDTGDEYQGPRINDLDESLTEAVHEYLAERGLDEDLAAFVAGHAWRKEHITYRRWLGAFKDYTTFE